MTVKDLAKRLGIGQSAAFKLMQSPGFPSIKVGCRWVVDCEAYERWYRLNQGRVIATPLPEKRTGTVVYRTDWAQQIKEVKAKLIKDGVWKQ